jgi:hypothetical protein
MASGPLKGRMPPAALKNNGTEKMKEHGISYEVFATHANVDGTRQHLQ